MILLKKSILFSVLFPCVLFSFSQPAKTDSLEEKLKSSGQDTARVSLLTKIALSYALNEAAKAETYLKEGLELSERLSFKKGIANTYQLLGRVTERQGKYNEAINYLSKAMKLYSELDDKHGIAECYNKTGDVYWWLANYKLALENYYSALKINEEINDVKEIATCYRNIGWVYYSWKNFNKAMDFFEQSCIRFEQVNDSTNVGMLYSDMGSLNASIENYKMSIEFFLRAFKILQHSDNRAGIAILNNNIALSYASVNEFAKAKSHAGFALKEFEELMYKDNLAEGNMTLGKIYYKNNQHDSALYFFQRAIEYAQRYNSRPLTAEAYQFLAKIYAATKKYETAFEYLNRYNELNDTILTEQNIQQVSEIQLFYETDKKQKEIELQNLHIEKQDADIKTQKIFLFFSVAGMLVFLVMAFFIWREYKAKKKNSESLAVQKEIVEQKNKNITASIRYAVRIQNAILPSEKQIKELLPRGFVLFKPKDIVSGDFCFLANVNQYTIIAAVDCTGHGVPGAFMSMIGNDFLNQIVLDSHVNTPAKVLSLLDEKITQTLNPEGTEVQDGMDVAFCTLDNARNTLQYAGANRPLVLFKNGELTEYNPDKHAIGGYHEGEKRFTNHEIQLEKGDAFYLFSDGYQDQFGGPMGKKFMSKRFRQLFLNIQTMNIEEQKEELNKTIEEWKGHQEQVDDILVIGVRV